MLNIQSFLGTFPEKVLQGGRNNRFICVEFLQTMILDYLFYTPYYSKVVLIGGANLRIVQRIDRFTEDIDFDCKNLSSDEFVMMTDDIIDYLRNNGITVSIVKKEKPKLTAFQRVLSFPFLFNELNISANNQKPLILKIQAQDQKVNYLIERKNVKRDRFAFYVQVPPLNVLCAMKCASIIARQKASDFYDLSFLLPKTEPDVAFLYERSGVKSMSELINSLLEILMQTNLEDKKRNVSRLLFYNSSLKQVDSISQIIQNL